jgi:hypothetical protein
VDVDVAQTLRDALLFEQYGGVVASETAGDESAESVGEESEGAGPECPDSYSVPAFVLARRHLGVVDNWADRAEGTAAGEAGVLERQWLRRDGELLIGAFERQAKRDGEKEPGRAIGARLAAEELALRLNRFRET